MSDPFYSEEMEDIANKVKVSFSSVPASVASKLTLPPFERLW